jgi:hypothetical protein
VVINSATIRKNGPICCSKKSMAELETSLRKVW